MNILITGAFGNIGTSTIENIIDKNEEDLQIFCFDVKNEINLKKSLKLSDRVKTIWGDLRNYNDVKDAIKDKDIIIHLAFILPPLSEDKPDFSYTINIGGTKNILNALKEQNSKARIVFASSVSVYGPSSGDRPPRSASDPVTATDNYTSHKLECEKLIKESGLEWVITRFAVVPPLSVGGKFDPLLFEIPLDGKIEFVHTKDVGLALANILKCTDCTGKILLIGGGKNCRFHQKEFIFNFLDAVGLGKLPENAFTKKPYYTDWMDTDESQKLLRYQTRTFNDYLAEVKKMLGFKRYIIRLASPIIKRSLLAKSKYYKR